MKSDEDATRRRLGGDSDADADVANVRANRIKTS